jgi:N-acetyl-anhydromuramyl-L-alanine amidase AmpD
MSSPTPRDPTNPEQPSGWLRFLQAWKIWVPILVTLLALVGVGLEVSDNNGDNLPDHVRIFKTILPASAGLGAPVVADADNQLETDEQAEAAKSPADLKGNIDLHEDTRDETPPGVSAAEIKAGQEATNELATAEGIHAPRPVGGAQIYSCPNNLVRNHSALTAKRVGTMLHFTVSAPGSGPAVIRLFDTSSFGASSNKLIELNGKCWTLVPDSQKAWAQLTANSAYFSIEIVTNDLTRQQWLDAPIIKNGILAALVRDLQKSIGSPLRLVDPVGCVFDPGITDHDRVECGNTHWDVGKNFPWDVFIKQVQASPKSACNAKCERTRSLKVRHKAAHAELARRKCSRQKTKTARCAYLYKHNDALHRAAAREHIKL